MPNAKIAPEPLVLTFNNKTNNNDTSIRSLAKNLLNEKKYLVEVDIFDRAITFTTITILIFTVMFFIWAYTEDASLVYTSENPDDVSTLNSTYKIIKYISFGLNGIAMICTGVQLYRRALDPYDKINVVVNNKEDIPMYIRKNRGRRNAIIVPTNVDSFTNISPFN
jgi:hypothetical protein